MPDAWRRTTADPLADSEVPLLRGEDDWRRVHDCVQECVRRVQLVRELQQVFLQHDWGTSVIDDAYRMFEEDRARRTRSTCRRPRAWTLLCTGSTGRPARACRSAHRAV
ncbi:hypothetical protein TcBrA4_0042570 [Trypanosoma cruzi]|nr:hypothetical protein TcBrA4_0042570 [Trypanosoma cruzi]